PIAVRESRSTSEARASCTTQGGLITDSAETADLGRVLINAQIAALLRCSKKSTRHCRRSGVQFKVEATPARTHGQAAVWSCLYFCRVAFTFRPSAKTCECWVADAAFPSRGVPVMQSRLLAFGCLTLIVTGLASFPARSDSLGLSVNGTCEVGSCPPSPLPVGTSASSNFSFNVTINGDLFNIAGFVSSTSSSPTLSSW